MGGIKILHVIGSLQPGGIETWLMNLLRLRKDNWKMDFFLYDSRQDQGPYYKEAESLGAVIHHECPQTRLRKRASILGLMRRESRLSAVLKSGQYNVVHAHGEEFLGDLMRDVHAARVPVRIAHCHSSMLARGKGGPEMALRAFRHRTIDRRRLLQNATYMLACSHEAGRFLAGPAWDSDSRCKVHYCGIPLQPYEHAAATVSRHELLKRYGLPSEAIVVGHVGSMGPTPIKNQPFLVKVFAELARRDARYHLVMVGDGPLRPAIQSLVEQLGLRHRVVMPGVVQNVPELMSRLFDVHVMPSISEGFGIAVTEAAAAGLSSVLSTGVPEEVSGLFPGRIYRISLLAPIYYWSNAIEQAIANRSDLIRSIERLRGSPFSIEGSAAILHDLYAQSLHGGARISQV